MVALQQQVRMVREEAEGVHAFPSRGQSFREEREIARAVLVVEEDRSAIVAALRDVEEGARDVKPCGSRHDSQYRERGSADKAAPITELCAGESPWSQ